MFKSTNNLKFSLFTIIREWVLDSRHVNTKTVSDRANKTMNNWGTVNKFLLEDGSIWVGLWLFSSDARYAGVPAD